MRTVPLLLKRYSKLIQGQPPVQSRNVSIFKKYRGPTLTPTSKNASSHPHDSFWQPSTSKGMNSLDGPLVWIDCEMTGLDFRTDKLLEIAVIITNGNLEPVDEGIDYVIRTEKPILDRMNQWCIKQHGQSGLTRACLESPFPMEEVSQHVLQYVKRWIPTCKTAVLAGSSVHVDKMFLVETMPELIDWLHYRIVDVSSIKELSRRWYGKKGTANKGVESPHRALGDIRQSIKELQWYRENIFVKPPHNSETIVPQSAELAL